MRHILYIINPISGTRSKKNLRGIIEHRTKAAGFRHSIYPSVANGDYSFLDDVIKQEWVTDIAIAGGDGTINQAISSLRKHKLPFGIIPSGSGNGLALSANISKKAEAALDIIFKGNKQPTDAFKINGQFACMLCGLGFDAQVAHDFANDPKRGLATYIRKTVSNFFTAKAYPFLVTTHKEKFDTEAFFISIANSNQFGNNFTIAPKASLSDGLLDIVVVTKQNKLSMLVQTVRQVAGFNSLQHTEVELKNSSVIYFQTDKLTISNPGLAPMHLDGDPCETAEHIEVKVLKHSFHLLVP